jgi:hypothetical protein
MRNYITVVRVCLSALFAPRLMQLRQFGDVICGAYRDVPIHVYLLKRWNPMA